ncbi:CaiB/BaiF CoA transferase family protein [Brevibacillus sp. NRS-1366]|uniref:CaiB/BaiF CoA transferase family protein n=1 Tax=Brevibacillus sp. NRS-1366 TaxID=3233899 RepID=UPI003D1ADF16
MKPLQGIRVLDFSRYIAGPMCTMYLAEWGAEVLKVEDPGVGDDSRTWAPIKDNVSGYFSAFNRSKKSITLDLKKEEARPIIHALLEQSEVVVCNFSPGVTKRLGIDYETLSEIKPDVIYCDISGFGQEGPYRKQKGFDTIFQAMGGMMALTGTGNGEPVKAGVPIGDYSGAFFATMSILASLFQRERTGRGEYIDLALYDCVVNLLPLAMAFYNFTGKMPEPKGTEHPGRVPSSAYRTKDGKYVQISVTDAQWFKFCNAMGIDNEMANDDRFSTNAQRLRNRQEAMRLIQSAIALYEQKAIVERCAEAGIPCGPVNRLEDIVQDTQLKYRGMFRTIEHELLGELHYLNFPAKFKSGGYQVVSRPPQLGEHTEVVFREVLQYSEEQIALLKENSTI